MFTDTVTGPAPVPPEATQHMVRMRDGVHLATDVYLPPGTPTQAVLVRLCYDKNSRYAFMGHLAPRVTGRGYAFVVQDVRGKFRSEGATLAFVHEADDGYDTIEWITAQPWSDGRVGMFGDSYYGFTQWAAASSGHPALRAIVPRVTSADLGALDARPDPTSAQPVQPVEWLVSGDYLAHYWLDRDIHDFPVDYGTRPLLAAFEDAFARLGRRSATFDAMIPRGALAAYPGGHPFDARPLPVLHAVGWFDNLVIAHMRDYEELMSRPAWAALQYLTADSTDHENYHLSRVPIDESADHDVNDDALDALLGRYIDPALDFFDVFVRGVRTAESLPRVRWHLGHVGYREAGSWPPAGAGERRLYLDDLAAGTGRTATLGDAAPAGPQQVSWTHEPTDLVPSAVDDSFGFLRAYPDEAPTGARRDVVVFTGPELTAPLDLAGPVELHVRVESTAPTTDVFAKLLDVGPDATAHMISRGQAHLAPPSAERVATIGMGHTGYRVRPGHRLRLHLASSDFPEYVPHPGTGDDPWLATEVRASVQTLHTDGHRPSFLRLTVLPG